MRLDRLLLAACLLILPVLASAQEGNPISVNGILAAQAFKLQQPYEGLAAGTLLMLDVDAPLVTPAETANAILYIADQPTETLNHGDVSGHLLVIVPADVDVAGSLMWFGAADLPEALTPDKIQAQIALAKKVLAGPPGKPKSVRKAVEAKDLSALLRDTAAPLVDEFSPQDSAIAAQWRLPEGN